MSKTISTGSQRGSLGKTGPGSSELLHRGCDERVLVDLPLQRPRRARNSLTAPIRNDNNKLTVPIAGDVGGLCFCLCSGHAGFLGLSKIRAKWSSNGCYSLYWYSLTGFRARAALLEIPIPAPALGPGYQLQRLPRPLLAGEDLYQLLPIGPDPAPVAHQAHGPEEISLDHERVKAPDALLRVDPVQHQVVLDWGSEIVRHFAVPSAVPKGYPLRDIDSSKVGLKMMATSRSCLY
jgi:hypothetical protein